MTPGKFLRLIWPSSGFYCIAHPVKIPGLTTTPYQHCVFPTISEAVTHVHEQASLQDVFFAVLSLDQAKVWNPDKVDHKTGAKGAYSTRTGDNMLAGRALFWDLDVGADVAKYPTQRDALTALARFVSDTGLPTPTLISSGSGVHVYWHFDVDLPAAQWRDLAFALRQLGGALGMKIDPTRTTDASSVLRVPDTFNWKDKANPRAVTALQEGVVTPLAVLETALSDALIRAGVTAQSAPVRAATPAALANPFGTSNVDAARSFGPPPTLEEVGASCAQVREIVRSQVDPSHPHYGQLDNSAWYRGLVGTVIHVEDGDNWVRKLTALHPRTNADTEAKITQAAGYAPAKCESLQQFMPWKDGPCMACRFRTDPSVPNPLAATRKSVNAPPPQPDAPPALPSPLVQLVASGSPLGVAIIPNPPKPYERLKSGGIALTRTDKDGNDSTSVIYAHDLYPLKRLINPDVGAEQQIWRATLPRSGIKDFTIDADVLYDARKFSSAISNNGIYPNKADIPALQDYMVAYISQLQRDIDADNQSNHLGWTDEYSAFVLPDKTLLADGRMRPSTLTEGAKTATQFLAKRGDLQSQVSLLAFYDHAAYLPNQFAILASLASIIFYMTGHHGIVVNMSGDAGASKSTTLYTGAGLWGDPQLWPINGTNRGATANGRAQRITTNANLPTPVDEITHLPIKEAQDLVMNITQPGHRIRLDTSGAERRATDNYKSAIMLATANSSLHNLLSIDNAAGTAGSMRVFEMKFVKQTIHTKAEADEFLRHIREHHGHIGEVFAHFVVQHRKAVEKRVQQVMREIDLEASVEAAERFWSAVIAVVLVTAEITQALRLAPYAPAAIRHWALHQQIPYMRGVVKEEYRDPLGILTDYIAEKQGNILVVERAAAIGTNTAGKASASETAYATNSPHGALLGHYDVKAGVLYLLKQGFKDHCNRAGASASRVLDELSQPRMASNMPPARIVVDRAVRRTLGAGTNLAKGQAWCFAVDMRHPDVSGVAALQVVASGAPTTAPAGQLKVV